MSLGLSHSLSRYKLKFSPEKVDTMIVQVRLRHLDVDSHLCVVSSLVHMACVEARQTVYRSPRVKLHLGSWQQQHVDCMMIIFKR